MGNLLVAPITEKETHRGTTVDGLDYAVSSMQGWRVHMEDAHIMEGSLYAEEASPLAASEMAKLAVTDKETKDDGRNLKKAKKNEDTAAGDSEAGTSDESGNVNGLGHDGDKVETINYDRIDLPRHSLFAVFDGHGGSFAAEYAGLNFVRVLARQAAFVQYAGFVEDLAVRDALEKIEGVTMSPQEKAQINRQGLELLEEALRDAFLDIDREIWREVQGLGNRSVPGVRLPEKKISTEEDDEDLNHHDDGNDNGNNPVDADDDAWQKQDSGTTATVVMFTPMWIVCANAGDSRSVYSKQGNCTIPLSYDHKPDDEAEERRIYDAGGFVRGGRVEGDLAVSRGLGDFRFKEDEIYQAMGTATITFSQYADVNGPKKRGGTGIVNDPQVMSPEDQKVSPMPDIVVQNRNMEYDEFVIVACDGIFDVQTNHECIALTADIFREGENDLGLLCEEVSSFVMDC